MDPATVFRSRRLSVEADEVGVQIPAGFSNGAAAVLLLLIPSSTS